VRGGDGRRAPVALTTDEKRQLNALLRRLMLEFERREQKPS
jgi:hypothetical protein